MMHIDDATSVQNHVERAVWGGEFYLTQEIPLPPEVDAPIRFIRSTTYAGAKSFWPNQLDRVRSYVTAAQGIQNLWNKETPSTIRSATGNLRSVSLTALLQNFGLKGARRMAQFAYGFRLVGNLSRTGVYPRDMDVLPAPPVGRIWAKSSERFSTMAKHSGYLHSRELRGKDLKQVELGWMGEPLPIDTSRNVLTYGNGSANIAFRFSVGQDDKLRACDDLKHNHVKLYCSVWTPIKLPTWDHIAQMRLGIKEDLREWPFFKADHESA